MILPLDTHHLADLDRVGSILDRDGIGAVPDRLLQALADDAKTLGVRPVAASVLLDPRDPPVVRERAFAVLATGLIGARSRQALTTGDRS
jgi:hypothetical protein